MNSKGGGGNGSFAAAGSSTKAKSTDHHHGDSSGGFDSGNNNPKMDQLNDDSAQDGEWEVVTGKKARNRSGNYGGAKLRGASTASPKAGGHQQKMPHEPGYVGTGNNGRAQRQVGGGTVTQPPQPSNGNWEARAGSSNPPQSNSRTSEDDPAKNGVVVDERTPAWEDIDDDSDDYELIVDSDEELLNDDYDDFEMSQKSPDTLKKSRWFNKFFKGLEHLTVDQMNEPSNQWHCPACQGGSGAIDWYRSMQALMTHARTRLTRRVLLHRKFAELLEEELRRKGISVAKPVSESFGRWHGLREMTADHEIVWPPMVVVMNTLLERDENGKVLAYYFSAHQLYQVHVIEIAGLVLMLELSTTLEFIKSFHFFSNFSLVFFFLSNLKQFAVDRHGGSRTSRLLQLIRCSKGSTFPRPSRAYWDECAYIHGFSVRIFRCRTSTQTFCRRRN